MKKLKFKLAGILSFGALMIGMGAGCGQVENAIDCHGICTRYASCYDTKYDTGACETRCRSNANSDANYMSKANSCNSCLDANKACSTATFACGAQCVGIVP